MEMDEEDLQSSVDALLTKLSAVQSESAALQSSCEVISSYSLELFLAEAGATRAGDLLAIAPAAAAAHDALLR